MLKLKCDGPLSNFAFEFDLRRYTSVLQFVAPGSATQLTFATLVNFTALCVSFNWSPFLDNSMDHFNQAGGCWDGDS